MTISGIVVKDEMGASGAEATFVTKFRFTAASDYVDGGTDESTLLNAAIGKNVTPIEIVACRCIAGTTRTYEPRMVYTQAGVLSAATFPTADQDTKTLTYILNGAAEATLTLSGAHTTAAHLAASINAIAGIHAYVDDSGQVQVKTDRDGTDADIQITGGTANTVYLFPTTANVGSLTPLLAIFDSATGLDAGLNDPSLDLSAYEFECTLLSK